MTRKLRRSCACAGMTRVWWISFSDCRGSVHIMHAWSSHGVLHYPTPSETLKRQRWVSSHRTASSYCIFDTFLPLHSERPLCSLPYALSPLVCFPVAMTTHLRATTATAATCVMTVALRPIPTVCHARWPALASWIIIQCANIAWCIFIQKFNEENTYI